MTDLSMFTKKEKQEIAKNLYHYCYNNGKKLRLISNPWRYEIQNTTLEDLLKNNLCSSISIEFAGYLIYLGHFFEDENNVLYPNS